MAKKGMEKDFLVWWWWGRDAAGLLLLQCCCFAAGAVYFSVAGMLVFFSLPLLLFFSFFFPILLHMLLYCWCRDPGSWSSSPSFIFSSSPFQSLGLCWGLGVGFLIYLFFTILFVLQRMDLDSAESHVASLSRASRRGLGHGWVGARVWLFKPWPRQTEKMPLKPLDQIVNLIGCNWLNWTVDFRAEDG